MREIGTFCRQFMQNSVSDEFDWEFNVAQVGAESDGNHGQELFQGVDVETCQLNDI